ncbi:hypothetical protein O181_103571, partial [Austropuccinia psidii MF-1]|nr:hypothetical protein [Austropuccinia psidii MF-1]
KDKPLTWFLKQKDRLSSLHPDMSDSMINMKILRKCGGDLEQAIKCIYVEPCSAEDYINAMEDNITRTRIGKTWTRIPMKSKMISKIPEKIRGLQDLSRSNAFSSDNEPLGAIKGNEVDITLDIDRSYPPVLKIPAYPASPRAREALEKHIQDLIQLGVLRKVGHNEELEVTKPVIIAWNNDNSRMVGDLRALNNYTFPDRDPVPRVQETLTQFYKDKYITSIDALKGFHQNSLMPKTKKLIRIITHCGIYEYLRMSFGIQNAASHSQRMMNSIFPTELSERWLIISIDDIIICSDSWSLHLERLARVLDKATGVSIDENRVAAVLLKPITQNKKEMLSFIVFASYYRQHLKEFVILDKSLYRICDQQKVFEMTQKRIKAYEKIRKALTDATLLLIPDWIIRLKWYIDACGDGLGESLHQVQIIDDKPTEVPVCYISRHIKQTEARYSASQMECLFLV